ERSEIDDQARRIDVLELHADRRRRSRRHSGASSRCDPKARSVGFEPSSPRYGRSCRAPPSPRHGRPCARHPRLEADAERKAWMAATSAAMTWRDGSIRLEFGLDVEMLHY